MQTNITDIIHFIEFLWYTLGVIVEIAAAFLLPLIIIYIVITIKECSEDKKIK